MPDRFDFAAYNPTMDGKTDDSLAMNRCFTAAREAGGGVITIPPGDIFLSGDTTMPLCSGLTVSAYGARFHLPEHLGENNHITLFSGTDVQDFTWHGGHFEGRCFDPSRSDNTWEPNANTRAIVIDTSPGGTTGNLCFRDITGHRMAGAVITVRGVVPRELERGVETFATGVDVRDCRLIDCGKFMWDYGLLWQMLVWSEDYTAAEVEMAWQYFRQDLVRRPLRMADGDDRIHFDNTRDPIVVESSSDAAETVCFFGDALPRNIERGREYWVVDAGPDMLRVAPAPDTDPIRFDGAAGPQASLITDLPQAYYHLFWPIGCGSGKGAVDLVACRQTNQTGNRLSALGDTMHLQCCHDNVFANNQITGSRMGAFFIAEYCRSTVVSSNTVDGTNGSRVMSVERSSTDITITGNTFRGGGRGSWINQPERFILQGNIFVNNTTKGECDPRRGRRSFQTGSYERYPELYFTLHQSDGRYGPVIVRDNLFVTGPESEAALDFATNGHDIVVDGNIFEGPVRTANVAPGCEGVHFGANPGLIPSS